MVTYLKVRNNSAKAGLIPDVIPRYFLGRNVELSSTLWEGPMVHHASW